MPRVNYVIITILINRNVNIDRIWDTKIMNEYLRYYTRLKFHFLNIVFVGGSLIIFLVFCFRFLSTPLQCAATENVNKILQEYSSWRDLLSTTVNLSMVGVVILMLGCIYL